MGLVFREGLVVPRDPLEAAEEGGAGERTSPAGPEIAEACAITVWKAVAAELFRLFRVVP